MRTLSARSNTACIGCKVIDHRWPLALSCRPFWRSAGAAVPGLLGGWLEPAVNLPRDGRSFGQACVGPGVCRLGSTKTFKSFARPVAIDPWPAGGIDLTLQAGADECRGLAERFGLVALRQLSGRARLERSAGGEVIRLRGRLDAEVVQSCVVSLEDVPARVSETFECRFVQAGAVASGKLSWDEDIEPLSGPQLDLGEVFAQQLGLALDPYPHAPDAYALVSAELGPNISFGRDELPDGPSAAELLHEKEGAVIAAAPRRGRD
jgi:Large ribosomal RNA subunit accumulation protein YceD